MDSFGDLYTLAFKNLSSLFLPIVLGMFATTLFFDEHNLRLYDTALDMAAINKALVVQDVAVISSQICSDTLEDYFKQITGGEGIA